MKFKNPCEGLKVNTNQHDLSDMFVDTLAEAIQQDKKYTRKLFNLK